jgi:hypothetical protein
MTVPFGETVSYPAYDSDQESLFSSMVSSAASDLYTEQLAANQPQPSAGIITTTSPLIPDRTVASRIGNFDPEIYNLDDSSHLILLLKALLGPAGAGGLRKQMAVARMSNAFSGMHFLDLDRFWGALFGIKRTRTEVAPDFAFDPYHEAADRATWDDLISRDASYRSRLAKFSRAIYHGASYAGLRAMTEALIADDAEIYEGWEIIPDPEGTTPIFVYTYAALEDNVNVWSGMTAKTWGAWSGGSVQTVGTRPITRSSFVVQPYRILAPDETYELTRVLDRFKPTGTSFTVNPQGVTVRRPVPIRHAMSDSDYWDIEISVNPTDLTQSPYPSQTHPSARPAFCQYQGEHWTHQSEISTVRSYTLEEETVIDDGIVIYGDGTHHVYRATDCIETAVRAAAARIASEGVLTCSPYAPARR